MFVPGCAGRVCTCHHLIPNTQSKVCILEPGLFPACAFLQFMGYSHAHRPAMNWTTAEYWAGTPCAFFFLEGKVCVWEWVCQIFLKSFAVFWLNKWVWNNVLVNGKQRKGSLAPILVNISLHGVASLPAMQLYVWVPVAKYALQGVKRHNKGDPQVVGV